ncbi:MAG TPA: hypothetical protein VIT45_04710 [Allosphingosinicella sp.]
MDESIKRAHERLSASFREIGYTLEATSGFIEGVKVYDLDGRYLFAWHKNPHHLLFYLRKPALDAKSTLRQKAIRRHPQGQVDQNPGGETTITLTGDSDTAELLGWLIPALPLPA